MDVIATEVTRAWYVWCGIGKQTVWYIGVDVKKTCEYKNRVEVFGCTVVNAVR
jgi:hypothetical protein